MQMSVRMFCASTFIRCLLRYISRARWVRLYVFYSRQNEVRERIHLLLFTHSNITLGSSKYPAYEAYKLS